MKNGLFTCRNDKYRIVEDESAKKGGWAAHCDTSMKFGTDVHWTPAMNFCLGHNLYLAPELINQGN